MLELWEKIVILKLILELLHLLPNVQEQIRAGIAEVHSTDSTGRKVANIATIAAAIAGSAAEVVNTATGDKGKP